MRVPLIMASQNNSVMVIPMTACMISTLVNGGYVASQKPHRPVEIRDTGIRYFTGTRSVIHPPGRYAINWVTAKAVIIRPNWVLVKPKASCIAT